MEKTAPRKRKEWTYETNIEVGKTGFLLSGLPWFVTNKNNNGTYEITRGDSKFKKVVTAENIIQRLELGMNILNFPKCQQTL